MEIIIVIVAIALFVMYAIGRASGTADDQSDAMMAELEREQSDAEAWERITR